jgi:hypothetical protein
MVDKCASSRWSIANSSKDMAQIIKVREELPCLTLIYNTYQKREFKRLCGVSRDTFAQMVEVLRPHLEREGRRGGQNKLSTEDQLLITLE